MERCIELQTDYLCIPIQLYKDEKREEQNTEKKLEIFQQDAEKDRKLLELYIPVGNKAADGSYPYDYYAHIPVGKLACGSPTDKPILLRMKGEDMELYFDSILCTDKGHLPQIEAQHPQIHFTAKTGWINDPNGLLYVDGLYHLYFQYNPFNISWQNMSWGHAVSHDLLNWEQLDTVMFPDENGTIFSGSGIVNTRGCLGLPKNALLYFYTAAGDAIDWSKGKEFTQRIAYSVDGGNTLTKLNKPYIDTISFDNRDPKVYWHEETQSYYMVLWIVENDFGILTSKDLEEWELTDRFTLKEAWECPDLFMLCDDQGREHWIFWSADGYYYFGTFDGRHFETDGVQHKAYFNKFSYAAQTYNGIEGRTISVPWFRLPNDGRLYTGSMGLPKELVLEMENGEMALVQKPVREFVRHLQQCDENEVKKIDVKEVLYAELGTENADALDIEVMIDDQKLVWKPEKKELVFGEEICHIDVSVKKISLLIDDNIFEVWVNGGIMTGVFMLSTPMEGIRKITVHGADKAEFFRYMP